PGGLLGGEPDRHRPAVTVVLQAEGAEDVRAAAPPPPRVLAHQLPGAIRVGPAALHHLDEPRVTGVAGQVLDHAGAVTVRRLTVEQLGRLGPPLALLGPVAVAPRGLLGLEP